MEPDFTTRNHLESVNLGDPGLFELLNRYKGMSPSSPQSLPQSGPFATPFQSPIMGTFPIAMGGQTDSLILSNMVGRLQADLDKRGNDLSGLQLNVNSDILKWLILLVIVALFLWVILKIRKGEGPGVEEKISRIERQLRKLRKNPPKTERPEQESDVEE